MSIKKYHKGAYGFPPNITFRAGVYVLFYTQHARDAAKTDKYGVIQLPITIDFTGLVPFEIEVENGKLVKSCYRLKYPLDPSFVLVFSVGNIDGKIRTVWLNEASDTHDSLDKSNYDKP